MPRPHSATQSWIERATRNPASLFVATLQDPRQRRPVPNEKIDWNNIQAWHERCTALGLTCDIVWDALTTRGEALRKIAAAGRAVPTRIGTKRGVVWDNPTQASKQLITSREARNCRGKKVFSRLPDGMRVNYRDRDNKPRSVTVYRAGYSAANATDIETMETDVRSDADLAARDGYLALAEAELRPETSTCEVFLRSLDSGLGDVISYAPDILQISLGSGRIKSRTLDGNGDVVAIALDEFVKPGNPAPAEGYGICIEAGEKRDVLLSVPVVAIAQETKALQLVDPLPPADADIGDVVSFGVLGSETMTAIITRIRPIGFTRAHLTLMPAAPGLADTGVVPPYDAQLVTALLPRERQAPWLPTLLNVRSDETVARATATGDIIVRIVVALVQPTSTAPAPAQLIVRWRPAGDTAWRRLPPVPGLAQDFEIEGIDTGDVIEIEWWSVSADNVRSDQRSPIHRHEVVGLSSLPPAPHDMRREGDKAVWSITDPPIDLAGYTVRVLPGATRSWDNASGDIMVAGQELDLTPWLGLGAVSIMVRSRDRGGRLSADYVGMTVGLGDTRAANVVQSFEQAPGFTGTITGGSIDAGVLEGDPLTSPPYLPGSGPYLPGLGPYMPTGYKSVVYVFTVTAHGAGDLVLQAPDISGAGWQLEIKRRAPAGPYLPDAGPYLPGSGPYLGAVDWRPWPGSAPMLSGETVDLRLTVFGGDVQPAVRSFNPVIDLPDREVTVAHVDIAAGGTRLPIGAGWTLVESVSGLTVEDDGGDAVYAKPIDTDPSGPLIRTFAGTGVATSGRVTATVKGY